MAVEVRSVEFPRYIRVEYEEFDVAAFFDEVLPFVRTPHRCYNIEDEETLHILLGVTHPVEFKAKADKNTIKELEKKLRVEGFKKAHWQWK